MENFILYKKECVTTIYLDKNGNDFNGLKRVGELLSEDVSLVTGNKPGLTTEESALKGNVIIAGTLGQNALIDTWVKQGQLSVKGLSGKRECYIRTLLHSPKEGVDRALVIVGSEKLGTIYGMFSLSEAIGVSPWVYWGDVIPRKREEVIFTKEEIVFESKEPSVKYRGFFLNDEWPSMGRWVTKKFGDFDNHFYDKVFQLLLRLKGNILWPAMWSACFYLDGKEYPLASADLAQDYGIIIGTSHHESFMRAGEEWDKVKSESNDVGYGKDWNYYTNKRGLCQYWSDSVVRSKDYNNIITIGMRGERDSAVLGDLSDLKENINLLKNVLVDQKKILVENGLKDSPKIFALYKEVEDYYYGDETVEGPEKWEELDDVILLLAEDNYGNVRTMPRPENKNRKAGWGIYYHFDYHGGPISYEWVNCTPLAKAWDQMSMAYDYGIRDFWVVNIGDIRPLELPLHFFMDLAYDFEAFGTTNINETNAYMLEWSRKQFGSWVSEDVVKGITGILHDYTRMNGNRKPEATYSDTFSTLYYREWEDELKNAHSIEERAKKYYEFIPEEMKAAYYGFVYFPAVASVNIRKMNLYAALSQLYGKRKSGLANYYGDLVKKCKSIDRKLTKAYNNEMANGKWKGMMSSRHIGFVVWNDERWKYPDTTYVELLDEPLMIVDVEEEEAAFTDGEAELPEFTNFGREKYRITISNGGKTPFSYTAITDSDWIILSRTEGRVIQEADKIEVSINWDKQPSEKGIVKLEGNGQTISVVIITKHTNLKGLPPMTFVESRGVVSIEAEHFKDNQTASGVEWKKIEDYGRTLSSMKMFPTTESFSDPSSSPYMEYGIYLPEDGEYECIAYFAPSNNLKKEWGLEYAISFDGGEQMVKNALPDDFSVSHFNMDWCKNVLDNILISKTDHKLSKGLHTLRFHGVHAGLILQKLILHKGGLKPSYYGPKESFYIQKGEQNL